MKSAKEEVRALLDILPDNVSFDEIQYSIYVREQILQGLEDVEAGRTLSQEEVENQMELMLAGYMRDGMESGEPLEVNDEFWRQKHKEIDERGSAGRD